MTSPYVTDTITDLASTNKAANASGTILKTFMQMRSS